jgi:nifR3 family TIM-barrel protein
MTQKELINYLAERPFVLAPMAGITDCAFRSFMREMDCGVVVTELVSATGLRFQSAKTRSLMAFEPKQHPIGVQLFGDDLESLQLAAREVQSLGADFVDLNFGCPVAKVVKKGAGAAVLKDLQALRAILRAVKGVLDIPLTIKIRTGWDEASRNAHEVVKIAADEGVTWVAIHGRTRAQGYSGAADWDYIRYVKSQSPIPVLGNGDISSASQAITRLVQSNCDGVLIGRGCLKNPWIFQEAQALYRGDISTVSKDFRPVFEKLFTKLDTCTSEKLKSLQIKKFASWYSNGYPDSSAFRKAVFNAQDTHELIEHVYDYFDKVCTLSPTDTSHENFLMGGHG